MTGLFMEDGKQANCLSTLDRALRGNGRRLKEFRSARCGHSHALLTDHAEPRP